MVESIKFEMATSEFLTGLLKPTNRVRIVCKYLMLKVSGISIALGCKLMGSIE